MTGPAKIAWIITTWMALMVLPLLAHAAAPRDAVRNMPVLTHTSSFDIRSTDSPDSHSYDDNYRNNWKISWSPRDIKLISGAWVRLKLDYETTLTDNLKRMTGTSQDTRFDKFYGTLKVNTAQGFEVNFKLDQQDTLRGSTPSNLDRSWHSKTVKEVSSAWSRQGYPKINFSHNVSNTYNYLGSLQTHGSEAATTTMIAEYMWQNDKEWQLAKVMRQYVRSDSYGTAFDDDHSGKSSDKMVYDAQRTVKFPHFGKFSMNLHHEETSSAGLNAANHSTNFSTQYSAGLDGNVRDMPVRYNYKYWTQQAGSSGSAGNQRVKRQLTLSFDPPVPAGKSAGVSYWHSVDESTYVNNRNTIEEQKLNWSFKANPRTNASFSYSLKQVTDRLALQRKEDTDSMGASLRYNIPGGRGSVTGSISERITRRPNTDQRSVVESFNLGTNVILGPGTSLNLFFNQQLDNTRSGLLGLPTGKDEFLSRVTYKTSSKGLALEAAYEQRHRKTLITEKKTDLESLNLMLSYQTNAKWKYTLRLRTNSESRDSLAGEGYDYTTGETIQAMVSYTF